MNRLIYSILGTAEACEKEDFEGLHIAQLQTSNKGLIRMCSNALLTKDPRRDILEFTLMAQVPKKAD